MAIDLHDMSIGAPDDGFAQLLHVDGGITGALKTVYDGDATATIIELSSAAFNITGAGTFQYGGVAVTSTAAELNILDGVTSTAAELNILDGATVNVTELNYLDGTTLGTAIASKVLACDASKDLNLDGGDLIATELTGTLQTAAQTNITTVGALTTLTIDDITLNANAISSGGASSLTITPTAGQKLVLDAHWGFDGVAFTAETDNNTTFTAYAGKNITIEGVTFDNNVVTATTLAGTLSTAAQGNITSLGIIQDLIVIAGAAHAINIQGRVADDLSSIRFATNAAATLGTIQATAAGAVLIQTSAAATTALTLDSSQNAQFAGLVGIGKSPTAGSALDINLGTEDLEIIDAGSAGATEQDWIEVEIGGNQGFIRVYAAI